jgi:predicted PolB exonuclease-like 3'-5' exonuclease
LTPILAFDIETIPDVAGMRKLHGLPADLPDGEVAEVVFQMRRVKTGSDFLPVHMQKVAVISCVLRSDDGIKVFSLEGEEADVIRRFYEGIEKFVPQLVSWNGGGFDLPVLNYRALMHGVPAPMFWETGDENRDFRYNNYVSRYHSRHLDLMDVLAMYQPRNNAPLDEVAQLAGLPGKIGVGGAKVWQTWLAGEAGKVRDYCEVDTLNTYLLFVRYQLMRGVFTNEQYRAEISLVRSFLEKQKQSHWHEFLQLWNDS